MHAEAMGIPIALVFAVVWGESEFQVWGPPGDQGRAHGLLQVRADVHGGDAAYWSGYDGAHRSFALMGPRWRQAWASIRGSPAMWERDPLGTLLAFWPAAQGANAEAVWRRAPDVLAGALAAYEEWRAVQMAIDLPVIKWIGAYSGNYTPGRQGFSPEAVVVHTMGGTLAGCDSWFQSPDAQVSAHFGVGREGQIHQYVDLANTAHANGITEAGYIAELIDDNQGRNPNLWTVSIEHDDLRGTELPTDAQLEASARLAAWLFATTLFDPSIQRRPPVTRDRILRHSDISPRQRANCPGWPESMLNAYIARVAELVAPPREEPDVDYNTAVGLAIDAGHAVDAWERVRRTADHAIAGWEAVRAATETLDDAAARRGLDMIDEREAVAALQDAQTARETAEGRLR